MDAKLGSTTAAVFTCGWNSAHHWVQFIMISVLNVTDLVVKLCAIRDIVCLHSVAH